MRHTPSPCGFTLIELLIVVIIIAALAAMVAPKLIERSDEAKGYIAKGDISNLTLSLKLFRLDNGFYPKDLDSLTTKPSSATNWKGPYIENSPTDPWAHAYKYKYPGVHNKGSFDLYSVGMDGIEGSADDVVNWQ